MFSFIAIIQWKMVGSFYHSRKHLTPSAIYKISQKCQIRQNVRLGKKWIIAAFSGLVLLNHSFFSLDRIQNCLDGIVRRILNSTDFFTADSSSRTYNSIAISTANRKIPCYVHGVESSSFPPYSNCMGKVPLR